MRNHDFVRRSWSPSVLLVAVAVAVAVSTGGASLPNVAPFTDATVKLTSATKLAATSQAGAGRYCELRSIGFHSPNCTPTMRIAVDQRLAHLDPRQFPADDGKAARGWCWIAASAAPPRNDGFGQRFAAIRRLIICTNSRRQAAWASCGDAMPGGMLSISTAGR
jgi:hypothetical protein